MIAPQKFLTFLLSLNKTNLKINYISSVKKRTSMASSSLPGPERAFMAHFFAASLFFNLS